MKEKERVGLQAGITELKERLQQRKSEEQVRMGLCVLAGVCGRPYKRVVCGSPFLNKGPRDQPGRASTGHGEGGAGVLPAQTAERRALQ